MFELKNAIGTTDSETVDGSQVNGVGPNFDKQNASYTFSGKKIAMSTNIPILTRDQLVQKPVIASETANQIHITPSNTSDRFSFAGRTVGAALI